MSIRNSRALGAIVMGTLCLAACSEAPRKSPARSPATTGAHPATATAAPAAQNNEVVHLVDARPAKDKVFSIHSLWITNCNYGVYTVGEPKSPSPMETLRTDLTSFESSSSKHDIRVERYAVYFNLSRQLKRGAVGATVGGMIGAAIGASTTDFNKGASCPESKMDEGGWYGPGQLTTNFAPLIVEMAGTFDAKPFTQRVVYSTRQEIVPKLKKPADLAEYEAALHKANHQLFAAVGLSSRPSVTTAPEAMPARTNAAPPSQAAPAADDEGWINFPSSDSK